MRRLSKKCTPGKDLETALANFAIVNHFKLVVHISVRSIHCNFFENFILLLLRQTSFQTNEKVSTAY